MGTYSVIEVKDLIEMAASQPLLLVDVRNDDEVARGIISGAMHIPLAMLPLQYQSLPKVDHIVFYCHSGVRSAHAAAFAAGEGCKHAYSLVGGILAWGKAGHLLVQKDEGKKK
jgi:rhodanese-related sulfurtransferase